MKAMTSMQGFLVLFGLFAFLIAGQTYAQSDEAVSQVVQEAAPIELPTAAPVPAPVPEGLTGELEWEVGAAAYKKVIKKRMKDPAPFLVFFYKSAADEAMALKNAELKGRVLSDKAFEEYMEDFDRVMIDADKDFKFITRFDVQTFPTFIVMRTTASAQKVRLPESSEDYETEDIIKRLQYAGLTKAAIS